MIKIVTPDSFSFDQPIMSLMHVHSRGVDSTWLRKTAAVLTKEMAELKPEPGYVYTHLIALGDGETYGCFFKGAPVQTSEGIKPIEEVAIGDLVLTHKNRYRPVVNTFMSDYSGGCASIRLRGIPTAITCTTEHPILTVRAEHCKPGRLFKRREKDSFEDYIDELVEAAKWVPANQLVCGDYLVVPCGASNIRSERPEEFDPYVCGLYLAEGCLAKEYKDIATKGEYHHVLFTMAYSDEASINYIQDWLVRIGRNKVSIQKSPTSSKGCRIGFGFKQFALWLDEMFGHTAVSKRLHPSVFSWSEEDKLKFIAGYLDGDGCIIKRGGKTKDRYIGTTTCSTASVNLALDMQRLFASIVVGSSVNKGTNKVSSGCFGFSDSDIYSVSVGNLVSNKLLKHTLRLQPHDKEPCRRDSASCKVSGKYLITPISDIAFSANAPKVKYNLEVKEDNSFVVVCCVHNSNRNSDIFPKEANVKCHDTFVKYASWYHNHKNKPDKGDKKYGKVVASAHNDEMNRVELIVGISEKDDPDSVEKLARGEDIPVSMACTVPWDECTACKNRASSPDKYCVHIKEAAGKFTNNGIQIGMINREPKFFDISKVHRNADRIAFTLRKVASENQPILSADMATMLGVTAPTELIKDAKLRRRYQLLNKLAEMEKTIEGTLKGDPGSRCIAGALNDNVQLPAVDEPKLSAVLDTLSGGYVCLPIDSFLKLVMGPRFNEVENAIPSARSSLPDVFRSAAHDPDDFLCGVDNYSSTKSFLPRELSGILDNVISENTLKSGPLSGRMKITIIKRGECHVTKAPVSKVGNTLAKEYARYKLAFLEQVSDPFVERLALLQNFG